MFLLLCLLSVSLSAYLPLCLTIGLCRHPASRVCVYVCVIYVFCVCVGVAINLPRFWQRIIGVLKEYLSFVLKNIWERNRSLIFHKWFWILCFEFHVGNLTSIRTFIKPSRKKFYHKILKKTICYDIVHFSALLF